MAESQNCNGVIKRANSPSPQQSATLRRMRVTDLMVHKSANSPRNPVELTWVRQSSRSMHCVPRYYFELIASSDITSVHACKPSKRGSQHPLLPPRMCQEWQKACMTLSSWPSYLSADVAFSSEIQSVNTPFLHVQ